jgi:hypothetical protein
VTPPVHPRRKLLLGGAAGLLAITGYTTLIGNIKPKAEPRWVPSDALEESPGTTEPAPGPSAEVEAQLDISTLDPAKLVSVSAAGWHSWALLDRSTGAILGPANQDEPNRACSMIKAWVAADYLRQRTTPAEVDLADLDIMIRDSDSPSTDRLMDQIGRANSFNRLRDLCGTTDFRPISSWSTTTISARDMCRVGHTIASAAVANPKWTEHVLGMMRTVRRGDWGIREAFPATAHPSIAIKNGWDFTAETGTRHVNCLAIHEKWVMVTLTRYPIELPGYYSHGEDIGTSIAQQLLDSSELRPLLG